MNNFGRQGNAFKRDSFYLWNGELHHFTIVCPCVQLVAYTWLGSSGTSSSLSGGSLSDPLLFQFRETQFGIIVSLFDFARINDVDNVVNCNRCLSQTFRYVEF